MREESGSTTLLPVLGTFPGHLLWRAHARVTAALAEVLPPDVDVHGYACLLALADGAPRSQQALADLVAVSRTTMVRVAAALADEGLVERVRNPADRRSYALTRTAAGAAAARAWHRHAAALEERLTGALPPADRAELADLLHRVVDPDLAAHTPPDLRDSIGFLVTRGKQRLHREFSAALAPLDLEPRHFGALVALGELGVVPQTELARALGMSGASVVQIVDDLEDRGLLERRRDPADRRTHRLHLLPAARAARTRAARTARDLFEPLAPLDAEQTDRLVVLLRVLVTTP